MRILSGFANVNVSTAGVITFPISQRTLLRAVDFSLALDGPADAVLWCELSFQSAVPSTPVAPISVTESIITRVIGSANVTGASGMSASEASKFVDGLEILLEPGTFLYLNVQVIGAMSSFIHCGLFLYP